MKIILCFFSLLLLFSCQQNNTKDSTPTKLGDISFEVTGNEDALPHFEDGMLLLHSFEFKDAAEKFRKAQKLDPDFAMAYWGEAMTENHTLWREQELDDARKILAKLGEDKEEQRAKFKTELEKDFYDAVSILYGEGTKKERDQAYSDFMSELHKKYPDHHEVASFYALSILGAVKGGRDYEQYQKGARIAQSIIDENPKHPGALHYLIHSYDDPENAPKALEAANSYSKIAPDAGHALHMPSHIYVALGMWDEVISSNIASWEASVKRKARKDLTNNALGYHSFKWLMYGYLQKGEYEKARNLVADMQKYCYEDPTSKAVSHLVMMKGAYFTETDNWEDELVLDTVDYSKAPIQIFAAQSFKLGMHALRNNQVELIPSIIENIKSKIGNATNEVLTASPEMCSGSYTRGRATQTHIDRAKVMKMQLEALVQLEENEPAKAEELIKEAMTLEEKTSYMYGPPEILKPTHELYAEWLVKQGRNKEAKVLFEKVLERAPKRLIAMKGLEMVGNAL